VKLRRGITSHFTLKRAEMHMSTLNSRWTVISTVTTR